MTPCVRECEAYVGVVSRRGVGVASAVGQACSCVQLPERGGASRPPAQERWGFAHSRRRLGVRRSVARYLAPKERIQIAGLRRAGLTLTAVA